MKLLGNLQSSPSLDQLAGPHNLRHLPLALAMVLCFSFSPSAIRIPQFSLLIP